MNPEKGKDKLSAWLRLIKHGKCNPKNQNQTEAVNRFNEVMLCKKFGWDPDVPSLLPNDWYEDAVTILNIKEKHEYNESIRASRTRHGKR